MFNEENERLLSLLKNDDLNAVKAIQEVYGALVYNRAITILKDEAAADDIFQEVFIALWLERKQLSKGTLLSRYLFNSTGIWCKLYLDAQKEMTNEMPAIQEEHDGLRELLHKEYLERAQAAILLVYPPACREILRLRVVEQMSYKEIAATLDIKVEVVRNQICRARKILRQILGES